MNKIEDYSFESSDFLHYFRTLYKDRGFKAFYQLFNRVHRRSHSRSLIKKFHTKGIGLEIGCGARTICPTTHTILSDAFSEHGVDGSIAKVFFKGDLIPYPDRTFGFILSEHVLEHIANPIKAINEWLRVLKNNGKIYFFLPHKERTNDFEREVTTLSHLIEDFSLDVPYNDPTHFSDWWENVVEKGYMPGHYKHLKREELLNTASIHHHVWTEIQIIELLEYLELKILHVEDKVSDRRDSFLVIAEKV